MGKYHEPAKVKLVIGFLGKNETIIKEAQAILLKKFGNEDYVMSCIKFTYTNYYQDEIGAEPLRAFTSYETVIDRENIVDIKHFTNELEMQLSENGLRPVNLDPGYLTLGQFFLASTKDQRQRVYIGRGIFVEPTLYFKEGQYLPFPWTYRDYRSSEYLEFFKLARSRLAYQLKHGQPYSKRKEERRKKKEEM